MAVLFSTFKKKGFSNERIIASIEYTIEHFDGYGTPHIAHFLKFDKINNENQYVFISKIHEHDQL